MKRPTRKQVHFAVLLTAAIAIFGGLVGYYFGTANAQQNYITNVLLSFCAGLLVSLVFTFIIQNILSSQSSIELFQHRQIATTVGLYDRFHSPEMIEIRNRIEKLFRKYEWKNKSLCDIHQELYINSDEFNLQKDWLAISTLIHFYENVADLIERELIDKNTAQKNFRKYFRWLSENENMKSAINHSIERGEEWYFISRWEYLRNQADF